MGVLPGPLHKSRHHKRRLIQPAFADLASPALKPGGMFRVATDWSNYAVHVRDVLADSPDFVNLHDGERSGPESPLTQVWQSGVESLVGGAPVKEGRRRSVPSTPVPTRVWTKQAAGRPGSTAGS